MLHEISRKKVTVNKHEESSFLWHNSVLVVRGNKTLHILDFSYNLHSLEKGIDLQECCVIPRYDSPIPNKFLSNYAARGLKNLELVEMVTNPAFWPHSKLLAQELTNIVAFKWSPENFIYNYESVLATVNSVGNVELFARKKQLWYSIMDFSKEITKHLDSTSNLFNNCPSEFNDMEEIVYAVETSNICWSPVLNDDNSCYLATAQKSGLILFWLLKYNNNAFDTTFCGNVKNSNENEIALMVWIPIDKNKFLLIITNEIGQVWANEYEILNNNVTLVKEHSLWTYQDKMMVTYLEYAFENEKLLIFFNKHRHLIVQMYDSNFNLLSQCMENVNDYRITSIMKFGNNFYLTTVNTKMYSIDYKIENDTLGIMLKLFDIKDSYTSYELYGIGCSNNKVLFALAMIDRRVLYRKESLKIEIIFLCPELDNVATIIVNNSTKNLMKIWDYIEILRCKIVKTKKLPEIDYDKLLKDGENDVYKLKVYLVFLYFYKSLESLMITHLKGKLPETCTDVIKDKILMFQSINVINEMSEKFKNNGQLSDFEQECFACSKKYLYYYCKMYKKNSNDYISEDICNLSNLNIEYTCQACDEKIIQFSCSDGHLNMFCCLTFTLIESDQYLTCKVCGSIARIELYERKPCCLFCDSYLNT